MRTDTATTMHFKRAHGHDAIKASKIHCLFGISLIIKVLIFKFVFTSMCTPNSIIGMHSTHGYTLTYRLDICILMGGLIGRHTDTSHGDVTATRHTVTSQRRVTGESRHGAWSPLHADAGCHSNTANCARRAAGILVTWSSSPVPPPSPPSPSPARIRPAFP